MILNWKLQPLLATATLALAACGGGGGGNGNSSQALEAQPVGELALRVADTESGPEESDVAIDGDIDTQHEATAGGASGTGEAAADDSAEQVAASDAGDRSHALATSSASCAGLVSRSYVAIDFGSDAASPIDTFKINAATLKVTYADGSTVQLKALGGCAFSASAAAGSSKIFVAKSGIATARFTAKSGKLAGKTFASVFVPKQTIALADLAGSWNLLQYARATSTTFGAVASTFTLDGAGKFKTGADCSGGSTGCSAWTDKPGNLRVVSSGAGGFKFVDGSGATDRVFAFKASDGSLSLYIVFGDDGGFAVASKRSAIGLPTLKAKTGIWDYSVGSTGYADALSEFTSTIKTVDTANGKYTRLRSSDNRVDTFYSDYPRKGLRLRKTNACTLNAAKVNCSGVLSMPLPGTGVGFYFGVAPAKFFGISVQKP